MKRYFRLTVLLFLIANIGSIQAITIFSGIDTVITRKTYGFDFVTQKVCTTTTNTNMYTSQMYFTPFRDPELHYDIVVPEGYLIKLGMVNLDSIKIAPHDSIFQKNGRADSIPPDSLLSRVGQSYLIHTGLDRRDDNVYIVKLRILGMKVLDSAKKNVEMRFLWCYSPDGYRNYTTSGLDTFNYSTTVISRTPSALKKINRTNVFKVTGNKFIVPKEFIGTGAYLTVYDLAGRKLWRMAIGKNTEIDISNIQGCRDLMRVIRVN